MTEMDSSMYKCNINANDRMTIQGHMNTTIDKTNGTSILKEQNMNRLRRYLQMIKRTST